MYAALAARIVILHCVRSVHGLTLSAAVAIAVQRAGILHLCADAHFRRGRAVPDGLHVRRIDPAVNGRTAAGLFDKVVGVLCAFASAVTFAVPGLQAAPLAAAALV